VPVQRNVPSSQATAPCGSAGQAPQSVGQVEQVSSCEQTPLLQAGGRGGQAPQSVGQLIQL